MAIAEVIDGTLRQHEAAAEPYYQAHQVTVQDVEEDARHHLNRYVHDNLRAHGVTNESILGQLDHTRRRADNTLMARALRDMGDTLNSNPHFQQWLDGGGMTPDGTVDMFMRVAEEIFSDGVFNFGRIAALFCFTVTVCLKAIQKGLGMGRILDLISWTMRFFRDRVAPWIVGRGGWDAVDGAVVPASAISATTTVVKVAIFIGVVGATAYALFGRR